MKFREFQSRIPNGLHFLFRFSFRLVAFSSHYFRFPFIGTLHCPRIFSWIVRFICRLDLQYLQIRACVNVVRRFGYYFSDFLFAANKSVDTFSLREIVFGDKPQICKILKERGLRDRSSKKRYSRRYYIKLWSLESTRPWNKNRHGVI